MNKIHTWQNTERPILFSGSGCLPDWIEFTAWLTVFFLQSNVSMPKHWCVLWCVPDGSYLKSLSHFNAGWQGFITCLAGQMSCLELLLNPQFRQDFWSVSGCCLQQRWRYRRSSDLPIANKKKWNLKYWSVLFILVNTPWDLCTTRNQPRWGC